MKKLLRCLLMTVMALCFSLPCLSAEAATVALLPLINNAQNYEEANQIFYKEAIAAMNSQKGFMMVENDKLTAAIDAANVGNKVPGENVLVKIAKDGDVIYLTFYSGATPTTLTIDTTNTSDIEVVPEANTGYEIFGKYNGSVWIVNYSEYTVSEV